MTCFPPKIPRAIAIPHSKRVAIIIIFYIKWEDTMKSITQVYLQQIRLKKYK